MPEEVSGFGVIPRPTVKVRMEENGMVAAGRERPGCGRFGALILVGLQNRR